MKKNTLAIFLLLILILFFLGCSEGGTTNQNGINRNAAGDNKQNSKTPSPVTEYQKGTSGIKLNFLLNSPPSELYDGQSFPFSLEITNTGSTDTAPFVTISGHDKNIIDVDWTSRAVKTIKGKSPEYPVGGYESIEEEVKVKLPLSSETYQSTLLVTACYPYTTEAIIPVCVDPDPSNNKDDICTLKSITINDGQGGPISIVRVDTQSARGTSSFVVTVKNLGGGNVYKTERVLECMSRLPPPEVDVVEVSNSSLGMEEIVCTPSTIRLVNGVGSTVCRKSGLDGTAYTTNLMLNLKYGYKTSITKPVSVRRM